MSQNLSNGSQIESYPTNEFVDYWQIIIGHRWMILAITAIIVMCSVVYLSILPNLYTAEVQILVERVDKEPAYQDVKMPSFDLALSSNAKRMPLHCVLSS